MRDNRPCFVDSDSSRRLLLVEFKGTVFLFTTLHTHVKVSSINFSKVKLSAKYVLPVLLFPHAPRTLCVLTEMHMCPRKPLPVKKNSTIIAALVSYSMSLDKNPPVCFEIKLGIQFREDY